MHRPGLEWAQGLHQELVVRIEGLRAALADIEPLRQELVRLEGQLRGVERLLHVYRSQLGYPAQDVSAGEEPRLHDAAEVPACTPVTATPSWVYEPKLDAPDRTSVQETLMRAVAELGTAAGRGWLAAKAWIAKRVPPSSAQS